MTDAEADPIVVRHRDIRSRLTGNGWVVLVAALVVFLLAINFANNLVYLLAYLLVSTLIVNAIFARYQLIGLEPKHWSTRPGFFGSHLPYKLLITNPSLSERIGLTLRSPRGRHQETMNLAPGSAVGIKIDFQPTARGSFQPPETRLHSSFPFGLVSASAACPSAPVELVYPAPGGSAPLPDHNESDQGTSSLDADTFSDLQNYRPGDRPAHIAWSALARSRQLVTRRMENDDVQQSQHIDWSQISGDDESRLSQLTQWILRLDAKDIPFSLTLPGATLSAGDGPDHFHRSLSTLALYGKESENGG
ncbi:MAG: DUF58 domain-containing protein [Pseudomonadota bacterium]